VATAQTLTLSNVVSGTGTLTKSGDGILSLTGTNTYTGATTVTGGELRIAGGASLSDTARLLVGGGALVTLTNADETVGSLAGSGTVALSGYCLTAGGDGSNSAFSGTISGPGCLTKTGTGTLTLTGTNTMDGPVTVAGGGTVQVTAASALGTGPLALQSGGTLRASGTFSYDAPVSLTSSGGTFEVDGDVDGYQTLTLTGAITGGGALNKTGLGWLVIAGTNTATGPTNVAAGTLQATGGNALGDESAVSVAAGARLIVDGSETTGSLAGAGQVTLSSGTLSLGGSNADAVFAGTLDGAGGLTKIGTGTQTLTGISTYAGDTAVQGGRLAVEGSLTDSDVYVYDQATLSGGGTITKTVHVLDGGTLAGTETSGLTMGALDLQSGSNVDVTLGAVGGSGVFNVTGNLTLAGQVNVSAAPGFGFGIYRIMSYGGTMTDNGITVGSMPEGYAGGVQTSVAGRINLFVEDPNSPVIFWNGANTTATQTVLGGTGTWTAGPQTNWINASGTIPKAWNSGFAVFQGSPGTVTVDDSQGQVTTAGMQFVESGYVVTGDAIALAGSSQATVRVGDGTVESAGTVATIASALTGTGGLEKSDYGTLILTGASTYTGGTTVAQGTLQIGNGGTSGSIAGNVADNATLVFNRSDATTFAGAISGTGTVVQAGTGTLTLAGNNSYAGGTSLTAGALAVATSTALGTGTLAMSEGTTLAFAADGLNLANAVTLTGDPTVSVGAGQTGILSGVLSDGTAPGDIVKTGAGTLVFAADNTYSGGTTISAGTLQLGNGGTAGSLVGNVTDNGVLAFNRADSVTFAGIVSGTGSLVQAGTGTLTLTGANTYTGGTTVASGTLAGNATSLQGNIANSGAVVFDQAGTGTYAGVVSGTGSLTKTGTGTLILTGENTYSGGTTISEGTLQLGNGGTTGSVTGDIVNNAALVFNRAGTYDFPGTITGSGSVTILTGTVNFLSANGYTGPISVDGSQFLLSPGAVSASSFTIGSGGLIGGSGTIAGLTMLDGGTVSPGYSPGTLTVSGNVSFAPGSVYVVDITPSGEHDLIAASGTATITGGTVQVVAVEGTYAPGTTYTILTAQGGVTGTFDSVTANYAFLDPSLSYDANDVYLTVMRNATPFPATATTANQRAVAGAVESLGVGNPVYDAVVQLSAAEAPLAFDSMTGEAYASAAVVLQQQSSYLREAVGSRLRQGLDGGKATAGQQTASLAPGYDATVWAQGYGAWGQTAGNGNAASLDRSIGGFFAGVDAAFGEAWRVGAVAGYSRSTFDVDARSSSGDSDNYDLGLYAGGKFGALKLLGGLSYTWHDVSLDRTVAFSGYAGANGADYKAGTTQVFGEAGWTIALDKALDPKTFGKAALEPFVGLAYVNLSSDDFTETGSTSALTGSLDTQNTLYSTLGIRAATEFALGNGATLVPHLSLGWQHAFGDVNTSAALAFTSGGTPFSVAGLPIARDTAILGAGIDYDFTDKVSASLSYNGQFASGVSDNAFKGSLNIRF
ncbi:autotransporter domain-containing protein, partial [Pseudoxanthobacter soli]|uniref:autotransporter domain-containing protein n=1 Tax=Pseudoxanthobacter soli TaxID=433840 RepID=UPI001114AAA1